MEPAQRPRARTASKDIWRRPLWSLQAPRSEGARLSQSGRSRKGGALLHLKSIESDADGAHHLAPVGDLALEILARFAVRLENRIEADSPQFLLDRRFF